MKEIILNTIYLILNTNKTNEEISQIIGGISPYTIWHFRRILGLKKFTDKTAENMTESNLKEFYFYLKIERDTLRKYRYLVKLLLTTDKTNSEIYRIVNMPLIIIVKIKEKLMCQKCDWQKIKAMSDHDFKKLLKTKCPRFTQQYLPDINFAQRQIPENTVMLQDVWKEYRQASLQ